MEDRTRIIIDYIGMAVGFGLVVLALVGELLGWWSDLGVILGTLGLVAGFYSALDVNGSRTLALLRPMHDDQGAMLGGQAKLLDGQTKLIEGQTKMLDGQTKMLEGQTKMLEGQAKMVDGQTRMLDAQTKMVEGQTQMLHLLDDRLPPGR